MFSEIQVKVKILVLIVTKTCICNNFTTTIIDTIVSPTCNIIISLTSNSKYFQYIKIDFDRDNVEQPQNSSDKNVLLNVKFVDDEVVNDNMNLIYVINETKI